MYTLYNMYTNIIRIIYAAADVCFLYVQKLYILYFSNFCINNDGHNDAIFRSISRFCKISGIIFLYSKAFIDEFIL